MSSLLPLLLGALQVASLLQADESELARRFAAGLLRGELSATEKLLNPNAKIGEWGKGSRDLSDVVSYTRGCTFKRVDNDGGGFLEIFFDCPGRFHFMSLRVDNAKIAQVMFGEPPPPVVVAPAPKGARHD